MSHKIALAQVATFHNSSRVPLSGKERQKIPGIYPYYGANGIMDYVGDFLFDGLHVLVGEDGTVKTDRGTPVAHLVAGRKWVNNHAHVLDCPDESDTRYLYYALRAADISGLVTGAVQPKLSMTNLRLAEVDWPEQQTRRAIAGILGALDDKIGLNRRMNETLEAMARALFKSWFVDFDPVRAKMEGRQPFGMDQATADLFPDRLVESEIGLIPEGWEVTTLERVADFESGKTWNKDSRSEDGPYRAYGANGIIGRSIHHNVTPPVIALGKIGSCGRLHRVNETAWITNNAFAVHPSCDQLGHWLWEVLREVDFTPFIGGSSNPYMPIKSFGHHQITSPNTHLIGAYERLSDDLWSLHRSNASQSRTLAELRDLLLPKLLSGEIRVADAEKEVEAAL